jgi:hypothetical protein
MKRSAYDLLSVPKKSVMENPGVNAPGVVSVGVMGVVGEVGSVDVRECPGVVELGGCRSRIACQRERVEEWVGCSKQTFRALDNPIGIACRSRKSLEH